MQQSPVISSVVANPEDDSTVTQQMERLGPADFQLLAIVGKGSFGKVNPPVTVPCFSE